MLKQTIVLNCCGLVLSAATAIAADEPPGNNAALITLGARVQVHSGGAGGLNQRWAKPSDLIANHRRPKGPIINNLQDATVTVYLPTPLDVTRVGVRQGDYRNGFAIAKDVELTSPDGPTRRATLEREPGKLQWVDYPATTQQITLRIVSAYPAGNGKDVGYGSLTQVQVDVRDDLAQRYATPDDYTDGPVLIMPTPNQASGNAQVIGKPRKATQHPLSIWDQQDIEDLRRQTREHGAGRRALQGIIEFCEQAIARPIPVPEKKDDGLDRSLWAQHNAVATGIANLGIGYALTGNTAYAHEARRLLLRLAELYPDWPITGHPKMRHDKSKWSWQRLNDAIWLIPAAWGYDLIRNAPFMTDADREKIEQRFLLPCTRFIIRSGGSIDSATNWSVILNAAALLTARVCGDEQLYQTTLYGKNSDQEGGVYFHLDHGIDEDGLWAEGAIGYQFMAMRGLLVIAETLWRDGIDIYSYRDNRLKKLFDSPIWYAYPGGRATPAIEDTNSVSLFGRDAHLYQYALRRYGDPTYHAILGRVTPSLTSAYNLFLPAREFVDVEAVDLPRVPSIRFPGSGFAITRTGDGDDAKYLILDHGPFRSHGHLDKLGFNLFALGRELFAEGGIAWYTQDIYRRYYSTTLAHNTLSYDGQNQIPQAGRLEHFAQRGDLALIRASVRDAIPAAILDRTMILSGTRLYDLFHVRGGIAFTLDLPYHAHGELAVDLPMSPWAEHPADQPGFAYFAEPTHAATDGEWTAAWTVDNGRAVAHFVGEPGTAVVQAVTPKGSADMGTAMLRRETDRTTFAGAIDLIAADREPTIASVRKITPDAQSYAMRAELTDGGYEMVMTCYDAGAPRRFGDWTTDARTAVVGVHGGEWRSAIIAGGTRLTGPAGSLTLAEPGLVTYRQVAPRLVEIANAGPSPTTVTLTAPPWVDTAEMVSVQGDRRPLAVRQGQITATLPARAGLEMRGAGQPSVAEHEDRIRQAALQAAHAREQAELKRVQALADQQQREAAEQAMPDGHFVLIQAEDFIRQGGGKVSIAKKKTAMFGDSISGWDNRGHWLEYAFDIEHPGLYQVVFKYCREGDAIERTMTLNGEAPVEPAQRMMFDGTGGWANGSDDWRLHTLRWPGLDTPALIRLDRGTHTLRLTNPVGGGLNLDYIVLASPTMNVQREAVEQP